MILTAEIMTPEQILWNINRLFWLIVGILHFKNFRLFVIADCVVADCVSLLIVSLLTVALLTVSLLTVIADCVIADCVSSPPLSP